MCLRAHNNITAFDTDHQLVIAKVFDQVHFIQCTLYQPFRCNPMVFFHQFLFQRTGIHTHADRDLSFLRTVNDCFDILFASDITRIDPDLIRAVFHGEDRQFMIEVNIRNKWDADLFPDVAKSFCRLFRIGRTADDLTAGFFQLMDLGNGCCHIFRFGVRHGLNGYLCAASNDGIPNMNLFRMFSVAHFLKEFHYIIYKYHRCKQHDQYGSHNGNDPLIFFRDRFSPDRLYDQKQELASIQCRDRE